MNFSLSSGLNQLVNLYQSQKNANANGENLASYDAALHRRELLKARQVAKAPQTINPRNRVQDAPQKNGREKNRRGPNPEPQSAAERHFNSQYAELINATLLWEKKNREQKSTLRVTLDTLPKGDLEKPQRPSIDLKK